jgi:AsmA protein
LRIASLKVKNLRASDVLISLAAHAGDIRLNPLRAVLYQGKYEGSTRLDVRGNIPLLTLNDSLSNIQAGPLLKDLSGKDRVTGLATLSAKLTAQGTTPDALKRSLSGQAAFSFTDGAVKGINIARMLREAQATLKGGSTPQATTPDQTEFSELRGTVTLVNGIAHNNDLSAKSPLLRVGGEGMADLVKEYMDYRVSVTVVGTLQGQGGRELTDLKGVTIPIQVKGPFANLSYRPDLGAALSGRAKAKVHEKLDEQKQKLGDQLQDKLKNLFR